MTYNEATEYLFCQRPNFEKQGAKGYKIGLDSMLALDAHVGHPHRSYRTIHVAGTNGKGTVSHTLAALLQDCGYKVGLYTSPHLLDFSERIRVNGQPIDKQYVVSFVEAHRSFYEPLGATFFEVATAMAFQYFRDQGVDVAVVEVGLGGLFDSTNVITPVLSVITNISLDHTKQLGDTVDLIARQKAGIMKPGVPCVIGEAQPAVRAVFDEEASRKGVPVVYAEDHPLIVSAVPDGEVTRYRTADGAEFCGELTGSYQARNTNTILHAMRQLMKDGYLLGDCDTPERIRQAEAKMYGAFMDVQKLTGLQGRWQKISDKPTVVCDTGHNIGAWQYLGQQLAHTKCHERRIVFGMMEDKDVDSVLQMLPQQARYYWTQASTKRALQADKLKACGAERGLAGDCYPTVEEAYRAAAADARPDDLIFVGGSNYIVAEFLKLSI